jgi:hypothetical protein
MPGPAVHTIISEKLPKEFEQQMPGIAKILRNHRRAVTYGAMGPDPFFFNPNDWTLKGTTVAKEMVEVWDGLGQMQYHLHHFFKPLQQTMLEVNRKAEQGVDFLAKNSKTMQKIRDLMNRLQATGSVYSMVMRGYIKKRVLDKADPFGYYASPYQTCESDHKEWTWFDTLHTRQTGDMASRLLDIALGQAPGKDGDQKMREQLLAYAVGYLSHLAADVVGHAYVNTMVGGPYRLNQAQRHTTQEKLMDVRAYNYYYNSTGFLQRRNKKGDRYYQNGELLNSGLHKNQQFTNGKYKPKQYQINHNKIFQRPKRMKPVASGLELPDAISRNFSAAANHVYDTTEFGSLTPQEVDQSYRLWYLVLRNSTSTTDVLHPKKLPSTPPVSQQTKQEWQQFEKWYDNNVGAKPGTHSNYPTCGSQNNVFEKVWDCAKTAASSVWNFITNAARAANELFKTAVGVGLYLASKGPSTQLDALNYFLQQLYENLHASYRTLVLLLTALGFGYCFNDQLEHETIKHLWQPQATDHFGRTVKDTIIKPQQDGTSGYPRQGVQMGPDWHSRVETDMQGLSQEGHLVIPCTPVEEPRTIPGPDIYSRRKPEVFITDPKNDLALDRDFIAYPPKNKRDTGDPSLSNIPTRKDYRPSTKGTEGRFASPVLGDAVNLTAVLFDQYRNPTHRQVQTDDREVPNLNMSGDRGIGYPNWWSAKECGKIERYRWWFSHTSSSFPPKPGKKMPWLETPVDPKYYPDTTKHY